MSDMIQNGYTKLTRRLFALVLKRGLILSGALFALTAILLLLSVNAITFVQPYESLITRAGIRYVFLVALAVWIESEAVSIHVDLHRNGGVYTMMMLPTPRRNVFLAYCTRGVVCVLMLWMAITFALLASYAPVAALCQNAAETFRQTGGSAEVLDVARTNGLFLAVVRSDLFHILLPLSIPEAISSLLILLSAGCLPALTLVCRFRRAGLVQGLVLAGTVICVYWALACRFDSVTMGIDTTAFAASTVILALLAAGSVIYSVRRLNRDAALN